MSMDHIQQHRITRNREYRACIECRRRKLRCDRQLPCTSCTRRDEAASCIYTKNVEGQHVDHRQNSRAEAKLEHLEYLVQELCRSREVPGDPLRESPDVDTAQHDMNGNGFGSLHNGATHWSAMLEDIEELRTAFREENGNIDGDGINYSSNDDNAASVLFGALIPSSFQQVLSQYLPPRHKVDQLVGTYFKMKSVAAPFIHTRQFRRLYQIFWDNPSAASPLWASILFSILEIASKTLSTASRTVESVPERFNTAAAQCLVVGQYHRPQRFAVEALALYVQSICVTRGELSPDIAILMGTLMRLGTVMGYHRDADGYQERISVFEGEIRRRTWSICMQLDMLISFQFGLPSNTQYPTWDTRPPTNLFDSDFDEDTLRLPPARPMSEPTELSLYIAKHKMMSVFEKVIRHTLSIDQPSDEMKAIDQEIRSTFDALPATFKPQSMADSVVDSPTVKITRLCVHTIYLKCLCVLHRKHITSGSRWSLLECYSSASNLVRQLLDTYEEFEPGGQLETERWFTGCIWWHDFLLGCTALCLAICYTTQYHAELMSAAVVDIVSSLDLLQNAAALCEKYAANRKNTRKVRRLIEATTLKLSNQADGNVPSNHQSLSDGPDGSSDAHPQATPYAMDDNPWLHVENMSNVPEDPEWAYLGQFLNLSNEDIIITS